MSSRASQESSARLEEAQRVAHIGHYEWNLIANRVTWSAELYRIYGLRPQEGPIDMAMVAGMIHPEDRERVFHEADQAIRSGLHSEAEHRVVRSDGEVRTVHGLGTVKRDKSGRAYEMFGTVQDITDRKRAEEALRRTQTHFREGQRLARMGSWTSDGSACQWSEELFEIYGVDPQNGVPSTDEFLAIIDPQDRPSMAEAIKGMLDLKSGCDLTTRITRSDGDVRYVRCVSIPVVERGEFKGFLGVGIDVTEQELLTQELRREQAYLAEAQRLTHAGSWASNLVTRHVHHSSDENNRLYGLDVSQDPNPFDRHYGLILREDEPHLSSQLETAIRIGADFDVEFRIRRPDGAIRSLRGIGHHNPAQELGEYFGITMDVTDRKRAEEEGERLRQLEADLAHINRVNMMGELAAALAHELKQPIAAAITSSNALSRWLAHDPPDLERAQAAAARIEQDAHRAADVIDRVRSFYRRHTPPERELVDVGDVIQEMTGLLRNEASRYSIAVHSELDPALPGILADRVQLQQVFMNLMLNAIEAMKENGGDLRIGSHLNSEGQLVISISDTGIGFPADSADQMFDAFHTTKAQGTGMGLAITRSIVESYGGRVWATRNPGLGATFHFALPAKVEAHT